MALKVTLTREHIKEDKQVKISFVKNRCTNWNLIKTQIESRKTNAGNTSDQSDNCGTWASVEE